MNIVNDKLKIYVQYERINKDKYDESMMKYFSKNNLINNCDKNKDQFYFSVVGFIINDDAHIVIMPNTYKVISKLVSDEDVKLLFKLLVRYYDRQPHDLHLSRKGRAINSDDIIRLASADYLIKDYEINKIYKKNMTIETFEPTGKTKWNKTISKLNPIISRGQVLYTKQINSKNISNQSNYITYYHRVAMKRVINMVGWLYDYPLDESLLQINDEINVEEANNRLIKELNSLNEQSKIGTIKSIIDILIGSDKSGEESECFLLITKTFHFVWEHICGKVYMNEYSKLKAIVPVPKWNVIDGSKKKNMNQIPDMLVINDNTIFVLDAKFYDVLVSKPGWHDVVKQFFYANTIKENLKNAEKIYRNKNNKMADKLFKVDNIKNVFIFPSYDDYNVERVGNVFVEGAEHLGEIDALKVNARNIIKCYLENKVIVFCKLMDEL